MEYDPLLDEHEGENDYDEANPHTKRIAAALGVVALASVVLFTGVPTQAHGVGGKCVTEEYIKIPSRYGEQHGHYRCVHPDDYVAGFIENSFKNSAVSRTVRGSVCEHPRWWKRNHGITVLPEACDAY